MTHNTSTKTKRKKPPNCDDTADFLRRLFKPGEVIEIRALGVPNEYGNRTHTESGFFDHEHFDEAAETAMKLTKECEAVYYTINPLKRQILNRRKNRMKQVDDAAGDGDVERLARFYVDADPKRMALISSTDEEKALSWEALTRLRHYLRERGWPEPTFGPDHAAAWGPCRDCARTVGITDAYAHPDSPRRGRSTPAEARKPVSDRYNLPQVRALDSSRRDGKCRPRQQS